MITKLQKQNGGASLIGLKDCYICVVRAWTYRLLSKLTVCFCVILFLQTVYGLSPSLSRLEKCTVKYSFLWFRSIPSSDVTHSIFKRPFTTFFFEILNSVDGAVRWFTLLTGKDCTRHLLFCENNAWLSSRKAYSYLFEKRVLRHLRKKRASILYSLLLSVHLS